MKEVLVLGIMSGTSIDGVDYALCSVKSRKIRLLDFWQANFPERLQQRLHQAAQGQAKSDEVGQLHHDLGRFYARHAVSSTTRSKPELAGLHGQTIFHNPNRRAPATLQLGEAAYLAEALRVPVVSNFRAADLAAGGEGAPLATIFHETVFGREGAHVCVSNLGGISNVTSIDWRKGKQPKLMAFDTGPGNVLMDLAMRRLTSGKTHMDRNGVWAARGTPCPALLRRWLKHPYFARKPPKSTGRELFGEVFWERFKRRIGQSGLSNYDLLATLTEFTVRSLALNYQLHLTSWPQTVILTGGGAANPVLVRSIRTAVERASPSTELRTCDTLGWPLQSIEAAAFALLAYLRAHSRPGNRPQTTGARRALPLGQMSDP